MSTPTPQPHRRLARKLLLVSLAMFAFGYALVPLYDVFCELTGINGKTGRIDAKAMPANAVDRSRWVTVEFTSTVSSGMPWEFRPAVTRMRVHPGEMATTAYFARNNTDDTLVGQAVPSVAPNAAAAHFKKIECFCFTQQTLQGREAKSMPVQFVVQPDLPPDVKTITLSYTFFNTDKVSARKYGGQAAVDAAKAADTANHDHGAHAHGG